MSRYPWIVTRTRRRILPADQPRTYPPAETCDRCGYTPVGVRHRKKCPACLVRLDPGGRAGDRSDGPEGGKANSPSVSFGGTPSSGRTGGAFIPTDHSDGQADA